MEFDVELATLRVLRLKGQTGKEGIEAATGQSQEQAGKVLERLVTVEACAEANGRFRLTPAGREKLEALLDRERENIDTRAVVSLYEEFHSLNTELKELSSTWQIRDGEPNDHSDDAYDQDILDRLATLHARVEEFLTRMAAVAPRLAPYPDRLRVALGRIQAGDHRWFLRPVIDSYHTVWFELHEDLIGLAGLTREAEAAAGRAE